MKWVWETRRIRTSSFLLCSIPISLLPLVPAPFRFSSAPLLHTYSVSKSGFTLRCPSSLAPFPAVSLHTSADSAAHGKTPDGALLRLQPSLTQSQKNTQLKLGRSGWLPSEGNKLHTASHMPTHKCKRAHKTHLRTHRQLSLGWAGSHSWPTSLLSLRGKHRAHLCLT